MATRPKAVIESRNGEKLSPITIAKNVLTDDGQNLHDILSDRKEDMMTPTIENSSSMFKVGQGDNVDYSENVVDGAYESCVLKGKSLVNILKAPVQTLSGGDSGWKRLNPRWSLKANTKYFALYFVDSNTLNGTIKDVFKYGDGQTIWGIGVVPIGGMGVFKRTFTLSSEITEYNCYTDTSTTGSANVKCVLLEYQEGMENWDIPYFEGICNVKSPILSNVGKNLLPDSVVWTPNRSMNDAGNTSSSDKPYWHTTEDYLPIEWIKVSSSQCRISYETDNLGWTNVVQYDDKKAKITKTGSNNSTGFKFTVQPNAKYFRLSVSTYKLDTVMIEEGLTATSYESYKSNTTTFTSNDGKTIVLRSLPNGVCDTLNVETGEYVQRISEVILNGSENWMSEPNFIHSTLIEFKMNLGFNIKSDNSIICGGFLPTGRDDVERIYVMKNGVAYVRILKSKVATVDEFKQLLQSKPVTIQYELETPIVKTVDLSGFPFSYENGHVVLSSGSIEQSLTPKVEYSVVTNRNGQIRSNQKMVERHQKQLDRLQAMILTNLANTQYEQTLTNLKYDLKNVREEVK